MSGVVYLEQNGSILQVIIERLDKKNALNFSMYENLTKALLDADKNSTIKVIVLSGHGEAFTAGNDLQDLLTASSEPSRLSAAYNFLKAISLLKSQLSLLWMASLLVSVHRCCCIVILSTAMPLLFSNCPLPDWALHRRVAPVCCCPRALATEQPSRF